MAASRVYAPDIRVLRGPLSKSLDFTVGEQVDRPIGRIDPTVDIIMFPRRPRRTHASDFDHRTQQKLSRMAPSAVCTRHWSAAWAHE